MKVRAILEMEDGTLYIIDDACATLTMETGIVQLPSGDYKSYVGTGCMATLDARGQCIIRESGAVRTLQRWYDLLGDD